MTAEFLHFVIFVRHVDYSGDRSDIKNLDSFTRFKYNDYIRKF